MSLDSKIAQLVEAPIAHLGYELVRVRLGGGARPTLQIMAERRDGAAMTVEDCARISRDVSAILDVEDPIPGQYSLEVSSPGLDRPLVRRVDYERFAGFEARIETGAPIEGRKRFKGRIVGLRDDDVVLDLEGESVGIPLAAILRAKLILTDELISASLNKQNG